MGKRVRRPKEQTELGSLMLQYRAMHGVSIKDCAEASKMSSQTWCSVENGRQAPGKVTLEKIRLLISGSVGWVATP